MVRPALDVSIQGIGDSFLSQEPCIWPHNPLGHDKLINVYVTNAFKGKLLGNLMSLCFLSFTCDSDIHSQNAVMVVMTVDPKISL